MSRKNTDKTLELLEEDTVSVNESTGSLQKVSIDLDEIARYHRELNIKKIAARR